MAELQEQLNFEAVVLHVDHGLRPDSADDATFVKTLAAAYQLPFHALNARVVRQAHESMEMAARRVRLAFFAKMMRALKLDAIATGHQANDVAETFLLRLARGSGADGLAGLKRISQVGAITFIRPLLDLPSQTLRAFLRARGLTWREDFTNGDCSIPRNQVRHVVLPWLKEHLDPHITEHICKSAAILRGDLTKPVKEPSAPAQSSAPTPAYELSIEEATGFTRTAQAIGIVPATCELSRAALAGRALALRQWLPGDRIAPTGLGGKSRKLQDVFVTAKVPPSVRATLPILADQKTGEVLWVPGYRVAAAVAVESSTAPSWRFTLKAKPV